MIRKFGNTPSPCTEGLQQATGNCAPEYPLYQDGPILSRQPVVSPFPQGAVRFLLRFQGTALAYFSKTQRTLEPYPGANPLCRWILIANSLILASNRGSWG